MNSRIIIENVALKLNKSYESVETIYNAYWKQVKKELYTPTCQTLELKYLGTFVITDRLLRSTYKHLSRKQAATEKKFNTTKVRNKIKTEAILHSFSDKLNELRELADKYKIPLS